MERNQKCLFQSDHSNTRVIVWKRASQRPRQLERFRPELEYRHRGPAYHNSWLKALRQGRKHIHQRLVSSLSRASSLFVILGYYRQLRQGLHRMHGITRPPVEYAVQASGRPSVARRTRGQRRTTPGQVCGCRLHRQRPMFNFGGGKPVDQNPD